MEKNDKFNLAAEIVLYTTQSMFLTGKAGTGKTTFLKYIEKNSSKNTVIVAPTGVAAINAGGMTMHSFFQLPMQSYVPKSGLNIEQNPHLVTPNTLFDKLKIGNQKRELMRELELLIIDEVSMVSADMLDCTDQILRSLRRRYHEPFGGVQVLFIGDLYQLPPVVSERDWQVLKDYYESPFFFDSNAVKSMDLLFVELDKIYRQSDQNFITVLNNIRNNEVTEFDMELLNERYQPDFTPPADEKFITLTTHNSKADAINQQRLGSLKGIEHVFKSTIKGDFGEKAMPTEVELKLKEGAQVMFIRNDGEGKKYYNGKLATIKSISFVDHKEEIKVEFENGDEYILEKETWDSIRYQYDSDTGEVTEDIIGSFIQYPIRLAWAITIHKSQGLTFEKAIIDAGESFAAGQVYVALSRCTSLEGMVLKSRIEPRAIRTDDRIDIRDKFTRDNDELARILEREKEAYITQNIKRVFRMDKLVDALKNWSLGLYSKKIPGVDQAIRMSKDIVSKAEEIEKISAKFQAQLDSIFLSMKENKDAAVLEERMEKSIAYFTQAMGENISLPLQFHLEELKNASKVKQYLIDTKAIYHAVVKKITDINMVKLGEKPFKYNIELLNKYTGSLDLTTSSYKDKLKKTTGKATKTEKVDTYQLTYSLYQSGKSKEDIAKERNLSVGTIETHFAKFIEEGKIDVFSVYPKERIDKIIELQQKVTEDYAGFNSIKHLLPEDFTYGEIRAAYKHMAFLKGREVVN